MPIRRRTKFAAIIGDKEFFETEKEELF